MMVFQSILRRSTATWMIQPGVVHWRNRQLAGCQVPDSPEYRGHRRDRDNKGKVWSPGSHTALRNRWRPPGVCGDHCKSVAVRMGDSNLTSTQYVLTTCQTAESLVAGNHVDTIPEVYLVVLHGHFSDPGARLPPGAPIPTGTQLVLRLTQQILDFGISNPSLSNLSTLGQGQPFACRDFRLRCHGPNSSPRYSDESFPKTGFRRFTLGRTSPESCVRCNQNRENLDNDVRPIDWNSCRTTGYAYPTA